MNSATVVTEKERHPIISPHSSTKVNNAMSRSVHVCVTNNTKVEKDTLTKSTILLGRFAVHSVSI